MRHWHTVLKVKVSVSKLAQKRVGEKCSWFSLALAMFGKCVFTAGLQITSGSLFFNCGKIRITWPALTSFLSVQLSSAKCIQRCAARPPCPSPCTTETGRPVHSSPVNLPSGWPLATTVLISVPSYLLWVKSYNICVFVTGLFHEHNELKFHSCMSEFPSFFKTEYSIVCIYHFFYPFIHQRTCGLLSPFGYYE